jgi:hypothetical protein
MPGIVPLRVGHGGEDLSERDADGFLTLEPATLDAFAAGCEENTVLGHHIHDCIEVVAVEGCTNSFE